MANKKTTHKKSYPKIHPQAYQFGGLSFLEPYENLTKQWDNFWRGGNYFNNPDSGPYNYDPLNPTVNTPSQGNMLYGAVYQNQGALNNYNQNKTISKNFGSLADWDKEYLNGRVGLGDWRDNDTYRKFIDQKNHQNDINTTYLNDSKKGLASAAGNSFAGIFSGLNYINSYVPPEKINLQQGSKGVMYQDGGLVKGPGMLYSPMMQEFGGVKVPTSKWTHFPNGSSAISALDSMLTSGRSKIYKEDMSLAEAMANYDPRLGNTAGKFSKYTIKDLKKDPKLKDEFLYHLIKNEVSAQDFNQYYAPAFTDRAVGPSTMNYQVTSRQDGGNVGKSLLKYKVSSENPKKTISAFEGPLANKINFNGEGTPLSSEFNLIIQNNDILEALLGMQGVNKAAAKGLSKHYLLDLLKVNNKHLINTAVQQAAQETATYQNGGNVNLTGYTPGTETMANPMNEIPSGDITMEQTPIPLLAIGKGGADNGLLKVLQPQSKGYNFKSKSTVEIPLEQQTQEQMKHSIPIAQYSFNNSNYLNPLQFGGYTPYFRGGGNVRRAVYQAANQEPFYQEPGMDTRFMPDARFNRPSIYGNSAIYQGAPNQLQSASMIPTINPTIVEPMSGLGFNRDKLAAQMNVSNNVKLAKGGTQKVAAYQQMLKAAGYNIEVDGAWGPKTQAAYEAYTGKKAPSKTAVDSGKAKVASNIIKRDSNSVSNINIPSSSYNMQVTDNNFNENYLSDNAIRSAATPKVNNQVYKDYYNNPNNNYNGPQFGPPVGTLPQDQRNEVYAGQASAVASGIPLGWVGRGAMNIPKVGPAIQGIVNYTGRALANTSQGVARTVAETSMKGLPLPGLGGTAAATAGRAAAGKTAQTMSEKALQASVETIRAGIAKARQLGDKNTIQALMKELQNLRSTNPTAGMYNYGGYVPHFKYGGSVNDQHAIPVFSSNLEEFGLTELQTEKNEVAFMPDGSIVDVKAKELHKKQDKHNVSDIMQSGTYVFSNDPKMKFSIKSKIGGVELGDMKLGRSVFKYVENEISEGPKDIMLKDMFFNNSKKELTTAEIAKNIKKNLPIVDMKNDYFADRAIEENKDQRMEYLSILKAFNEYKKPKQKNIPKAQYGMPIQYSQNGLDGVMGYGDKQMDPYKRMDNNMISMWNMPQPKLPNIPKMYEDGGSIPQAQLGKLLRYTVPGAYFVSEWIGNNKKKKQERENAVLSAEAQGYRDQLQDGVDRSGTIGVGTNLATYAASLNVPLQRYDDQSEQMAMYNAAANRAAQRLEATKYTTSQGIGGASSLARYSNPTNYGDYLSKVQSQSDSNIGRINQAIADLDMARANQNVGFVSARNAGRNQSLNARDTQLYNANVQGLGNVGRSAQEATFNSADTRYRMGNEKMAYDAYLKDKAQAAKDKVIQDWEGSLDALGQIGLTAATGGFGDLGGGSGENNIIGSSGVTAAQQASNNAYMQNGMANSMNNFLQNRNNSFNPIQPLPPILNRNGVNNGNFMNRNTDNWNYNFFDLSTWR